MIRAALLALLSFGAFAADIGRAPGFQPMQLISSVAPEYPSLASRNRVNATVIASVMVGADGRVRRAEIVSGPRVFRRNAIAALDRWVFRPASWNGTAIAGSMQIRINFRVE